MSKSVVRCMKPENLLTTESLCIAELVHWLASVGDSFPTEELVLETEEEYSPLGFVVDEDGHWVDDGDDAFWISEPRGLVHTDL